MHIYNYEKIAVKKYVICEKVPSVILSPTVIFSYVPLKSCVATKTGSRASFIILNNTLYLESIYKNLLLIEATYRTMRAHKTSANSDSNVNYKGKEFFRISAEENSL